MDATHQLITVLRNRINYRCDENEENFLLCASTENASTRITIQIVEKRSPLKHPPRWITEIKTDMEEIGITEQDLRKITNKITIIHQKQQILRETNKTDKKDLLR